MSQSPLASSVRTLFCGESVNDTPLPSTQAGSGGSVNDTKVISKGTFQCDNCPEEDSSKNDLNNHIIKNHNKAPAAPQNDKDNSATKSDQEEYEEIVQDMRELGNMITVDKIVDSFVETAFRELNPNTALPKPVCHKFTLKD